MQDNGFSFELGHMLIWANGYIFEQMARGGEKSSKNIRKRHRLQWIGSDNCLQMFRGFATELWRQWIKIPIPYQQVPVTRVLQYVPSWDLRNVITHGNLLCTSKSHCVKRRRKWSREYVNFPSWYVWMWLLRYHWHSISPGTKSS